MDIILERAGDAFHIATNRPAKRNALTAAMYAAMADALAEAEENDAVRAVIFSGAGPDFCAGNDLADFVAHPTQPADAPVFRFLRGLAGARKILIAGVQGRAIGIGTTMLLHCDFVLVEPDAQLRMPFVDLALVPEAGSSLLIPDLVGPRRAAELLLLGEAISAEQAVQMGLVNRVVPTGQALAAAREIAARLATKPAGALLATKKLMKSPTRDLPARMNEEIAAFGVRLQTQEVRDVVERFFRSR